MAAPDDTDGPPIDRQLVLDRIAEVLSVLSAIKSGDFTRQLKADLPETHPIGAMYYGINQTIASLSTAQQRSQTYQKELEDKLATIERQQLAIRELSTPVIEMWEGVLCLPIVGVMDSTRSAEMTEALLRTITEKKSRCAIIDITGIEVMDTGAADHFMRMAKAVRFLGAKCLLSGISPTLAQTIVHMGLDFSDVLTFRNLRAALQAYVEGRLDEDGMLEDDPDSSTFSRS